MTEVKKISFKDYKERFLEALNVQEDYGGYHVIFYKLIDSGDVNDSNRFTFEISFSWNMFIIKTKINMNEIRELYRSENSVGWSEPINSNLELPADANGAPMLKKFYAEYLLNRGIKEV